MKFLIVVFIALCLVKLSKGEHATVSLILIASQLSSPFFQDTYATSAIQRMKNTASTSHPSPTIYTKAFTVI